MGWRGNVARDTLAKASSIRDWRIYCEFAAVEIVVRLRGQSAGGQMTAPCRREPSVPGSGGHAARRSAEGARLPILLYHRIGPPVPGTEPGLSIPLAKFERQMRWLAGRGYQGIRPSDWLGWRLSGNPLPRKPVLITFDDGYADVSRYALPLLERYRFGAVVYVVTHRTGGRDDWSVRPGQRGALELMTAEQIRDWSMRGIEFGGHSRTHRDLTALSEAEAIGEVRGCQEDLAEILGQHAISFAYPYGRYNPAVRAAARQHFRLAMTCDDGVNDLDTDHHLLKRKVVNPGDSLVEFACKVLWGCNPIGYLRSRLRLRSRVMALLHRSDAARG
jgi:peptidoglycan/xylan/chitin deacetylase (PgdA/CDA1 family)